MFFLAPVSEPVPFKSAHDATMELLRPRRRIIEGYRRACSPGLWYEEKDLARIIRKYHPTLPAALGLSVFLIALDASTPWLR